MTELTLHNVKTIKLSKVRKLDTTYTRSIEIIHYTDYSQKNTHRIEITLFSQNPKHLLNIKNIK